MNSNFPEILISKVCHSIFNMTPITGQNDSNHNEEPITPTATQTRELSTEIELNTLAHYTELNKIASISHNSTPYESSPTLLSFSEASESSSEKSKHSNFDTFNEDPSEICNNCSTLLDDIDIPLPLPIYLHSFLYECTSPWLHYGYCMQCLEVARFRDSESKNGSQILEHIPQCEGLVDQCWEGELEEHIRFYEYKEAQEDPESLHTPAPVPASTLPQVASSSSTLACSPTLGSPTSVILQSENSTSTSSVSVDNNQNIKLSTIHSPSSTSTQAPVSAPSISTPRDPNICYRCMHLSDSPDGLCTLCPCGHPAHHTLERWAELDSQTRNELQMMYRD